MKVLASMRVWCVNHAGCRPLVAVACCPTIFRQYEWGSVPPVGSNVELADGWATNTVTREYWMADGTGSIELDDMSDYWESELSALLAAGWHRDYKDAEAEAEAEAEKSG